MSREIDLGAHGDHSPSFKQVLLYLKDIRNIANAEQKVPAGTYV